MSSGKLLLGVLGGVAAGALLGVLFAPDKGWNTRKRIVRKADEYADALQDKFNELLETVNDRIENVKGEVSDLVGKAEAGMEDLKDKAVKTAG